MTPKRSEWLHLVYGLQAKLGRLPTAPDIAKVRGTARRVEFDTALRALEDGQVVRVPSREQRHAVLPFGVRLTPSAMVELGIPVLTYLAWPMDPGFGAESRGAWARWSSQLVSLGLVPVSSFSVLRTEPVEPAQWMACACTLASRCDAVVAVGDPILIGRPDVSSAKSDGVMVSVIGPTALFMAARAVDLWKPPFLVV